MCSLQKDTGAKRGWLFPCFLRASSLAASLAEIGKVLLCDVLVMVKLLCFWRSKHCKDGGLKVEVMGKEWWEAWIYSKREELQVLVLKGYTVGTFWTGCCKKIGVLFCIPLLIKTEKKLELLETVRILLADLIMKITETCSFFPKDCKSLSCCVLFWSW